MRYLRAIVCEFLLGHRWDRHACYAGHWSKLCGRCGAERML